MQELLNPQFHSMHDDLDRCVTPDYSLHDPGTSRYETNLSLHSVVTNAGAVGGWRDLQCQTPAVDTALGVRFLRPGLMLQHPSPELAACVQSLCPPSVTSRMLLQLSRTCYDIRISKLPPCIEEASYIPRCLLDRPGGGGIMRMLTAQFCLCVGEIASHRMHKFTMQMRD